MKQGTGLSPIDFATAARDGFMKASHACLESVTSECAATCVVEVPGRGRVFVAIVSTLSLDDPNPGMDALNRAAEQIVGSPGFVTRVVRA